MCVCVWCCRYNTVARSQQNSDFVRKNIQRSLIAIWLGVGMSTLPLLFGWSSARLDVSNLVCAPNWSDSSLIDRAYPIHYMIIGLGIPFAIKAVCYYKVFIKVYNVTRKTHYRTISVLHLAMRVSNASRASVSSLSSRSQNHRTSTASAIGNVNQGIQRIHDSQDMKQQRKLAQVIVIIVLISLLSWGPYGVLLIALSYTQFVTPLMLIVSSLMAKACVVYNPLIYVAFNKKFRKRFIRALKCQNKHRASNTQPAANAVGPAPITPVHVPQNTGQHTRNLHRYSNAKRYSVPMLSTIEEQDRTKQNVTHSSKSSDDDVAELIQYQSSRALGKVSLPESEIRKAQELLKARNNTEMMQYIKKSRPPSKKIHKQSADNPTKTTAKTDAGQNSAKVSKISQDRDKPRSLMKRKQVVTNGHGVYAQREHSKQSMTTVKL